MKKIFLICTVLVANSVSFAQDFGVWESAHPNRVQHNKLTRALSRIFAAPPAKKLWVKSVETQVHAATPYTGIIGGVILDFVPIQPNAFIPPSQKKVVQSQLDKWQEAIRQHKILNRFRVKVVRAQDVQAIYQHKIQGLTEFLASSPFQTTSQDTYNPKEVQEYKHYLVRITLNTPQQDTSVHLLLNCYTREMYVLSGSVNLPGITLEKLEKSNRTPKLK